MARSRRSRRRRIFTDRRVSRHCYTVLALRTTGRARSGAQPWERRRGRTDRVPSPSTWRRAMARSTSSGRCSPVDFGGRVGQSRRRDGERARRADRTGRRGDHRAGHGQQTSWRRSSSPSQPPIRHSTATAQSMWPHSATRQRLTSSAIVTQSSPGSHASGPGLQLVPSRPGRAQRPPSLAASSILSCGMTHASPARHSTAAMPPPCAPSPGTDVAPSPGTDVAPSLACGAGVAGGLRSPADREEKEHGAAGLAASRR
jgi:hypothetical protein